MKNPYDVICDAYDQGLFNNVSVEPLPIEVKQAIRTIVTAYLEDVYNKEQENVPSA